VAWLTEAELKTLEKKAGFIGVIHREGYEETRIEVQRLIDEYRILKKEKEEKKNEIQ
jgi:hypothetical protein